MNFYLEINSFNSKSFKRPRRWSTYIKEDEKHKQIQTKAGTLPRIKGIWDARKYKDLTLKKQQWRGNGDFHS